MTDITQSKPDARPSVFGLDTRRRVAVVILIAMLLPLICLLAFRFWGEQGLVTMVMVLPGVIVAGYFLRPLHKAGPPARQVSGTRADFIDLLTPYWKGGEGLDMARAETACFILEIDDFAKLQERFGHLQADLITERVGARIRATLRPDDLLLKTGDGRYGFALQPEAQIDLETCINIAGRIQTAVEKVVRTDRLTFHATAAIGFCQRSHATGNTAGDWLEAAEVALADAQMQGLGGLRGFTRDLAQKSQIHARLRKAADAALDAGEISAWFQPQISTDTGDVTGFEALARWHHPELGVLGPGQFLPALEEANLMGKLADVMLQQAIEALARFDTAGLAVPRIGVNFSEAELRDPTLPDRVGWRLEQAGIPASRLAIEVLESVVTDDKDTVINRCLTRLADLGCGIDMDDFGTGNASISAIRRLRVSRIKIDRSLVKNVDSDADQQKVIAAVLTMTEKLGIDTLAEGVETPAEHAIMAQLGCQHVQGYGVGLPMPLADTMTWIGSHRAMMAPPPTVGSPRSSQDR